MVAPLMYFVCRSCVCWWGVPGDGTRLQGDEDGERMVLYVRGSHQTNIQCSIHRDSKVSAKPIIITIIIIVIIAIAC